MSDGNYRYCEKCGGMLSLHANGECRFTVSREWTEDVKQLQEEKKMQKPTIVKRFKSKPKVIEALQFNGDNCFEILHFMDRSSDIIEAELNNTDWPTIYTLEGDMSSTPGDWIIKGIQGEFYTIKNDIFLQSYEPVGEK